MEPLKYYYECYDNRELPEEERGYALITPIPAAEANMITDHLISASMRDKKKVNINFGEKSFQLNRKYCPKAYNVKDPLTDEVYPELGISEIYKDGRFKSLYEELSNAAGDINQLREGLKKK